MPAKDPSAPNCCYDFESGSDCFPMIAEDQIKKLERKKQKGKDKITAEECFPIRRHSDCKMGKVKGKYERVASPYVHISCITTFSKDVTNNLIYARYPNGILRTDDIHVLFEYCPQRQAFEGITDLIKSMSEDFISKADLRYE